MMVAFKILVAFNMAVMALSQLDTIDKYYKVKKNYLGSTVP